MDIARRCKQGWLASYMEYTEEWEPPVLFNKWSALTTLAMAIGRKVWLEDGNRQVHPSLYTILIGPPGVGKTNAMREVSPFLDKVNVARSPAQITSARLVESIGEGTRHDSKMGIYTPYLIWAEEFSTFLGMDAYKTGMIQVLTALWDCPEEYGKETKHSRSDLLVKPYVCMLGGTTPVSLFSALPPDTTAQGFASRLMFVYSYYPQKRVVEKPWRKKHQDLRDALLKDIEHIGNLYGPMTMDNVALTLWTDYYANRPPPEVEFSDTRMQGYAARKPFYVKKLAMLLSVSEGDSMVINAMHLEGAITLLEEIDKQLFHVYSEIAPNVIVNSYPKLMRALEGARDKTMPHSELLRKFSYSMDSGEFKRAIDGLCDMGLVEKLYGGADGKMPKVYYRIRKGEARWFL